MVRIILIIGASACFVIGGKMVAWDIMYRIYDPFSLLFALIPFLPMILMARRYNNGTVIYGITGAFEATIIVLNRFLVLR